jgi:hypothetical protein
MAKDSSKASENIETRFATALERAAQALDSNQAAKKLSEWSQATQAV